MDINTALNSHLNVSSSRYPPFKGLSTQIMLTDLDFLTSFISLIQHLQREGGVSIAVVIKKGVFKLDR